MKKPKKTKKMGIGGLMAIKEGGVANISPVAAAIKSLESGEPEGLLRATPIGQALSAREAKKDRGRAAAASSAASKPSPSQGASRSGRMERPTLATRGMKKGGTTRRGDGICQRGKTKGRMV